MWMVMKKVIAAGAATVALGLLSSNAALAADVDIGAAPPGGGVNGTLVGTEDTVSFTLSEVANGVDILVTFSELTADITQILICDRDLGSCGSGDIVAQTSGDLVAGSSQTARFTYVSGTTYYAKVTGTDGSRYDIALSAVPLPAAAWMFLSMLFGGAWIKRRSARSKGGVVATA